MIGEGWGDGWKIAKCDAASRRQKRNNAQVRIGRNAMPHGSIKVAKLRKPDESVLFHKNNKKSSSNDLGLQLTDECEQIFFSFLCTIIFADSSPLVFTPTP